MNFFSDMPFALRLYLVFIFIYAVVIMSSYLFLAMISIFSLRKYVKTHTFVDYDIMLGSDLAPNLSLIAPSYNEGKTIIENVKSLLSLNYANYEVIVVNDGSKDDTSAQLISTYDLYPIEVNVGAKIIETAEVQAVYKSSNPAFKKLTYIEKLNGGKADALNVGLNYAKNEYVVCIDVDCILEKDSLLKLAKPFLQENDKKVIATGGVIRIANQCIIEDGRLTQINVPKNFIARIQVIEYLRAFLLGRMAWDKMDGLLLISGAFGAFDKKIALEAGGYDTSTVGEDMELLVRMRRYMIENKRPYTVAFIPDPLCWTEAPESAAIFKRQRSRWMRGTMETLYFHRKMFLNPKYKVLGMLSVPYWTFFEFLAPAIEFIGLVVTLVFIYFGYINWHFFILQLIFVYTFAAMFSTIALLSEERTYSQYSKMSDYLKLFVGVLLEPIYFHPLVVYSAFVGYREKIIGKKSWGEMTRIGFSTNKNQTYKKK